MNEPKPNQTPLTRRSFLRTTSTALAGGSLLATMPVERFALGASPGDTIKIAVVGCGGRGTGAADQALTAGEDGVKVVAMADAFKSSIDRALDQLKGHKERLDVKPEHRFVGLDAYKDAIAMADMVILATPPGFRPIHFEEAVKQGKHIFMEKPVAVDGPGVRRVLLAAQEAKKKNLKVGVGLQRHHQPNYMETIERLHNGAIGDITTMRVYWDNQGPVGPKAFRAKLAQAMHRAPTEMEYQIANWYMFTWLCGDHIVEQHIHNLDVANWVLNKYPVRCMGMGGRSFLKGPDSGEIFDHFNVEYEYEGGIRVFSQCRQIPGFGWNPVSEYATGTKGKCDVSGFTITGANPWRFTRKAEPGKTSFNNGHQLEHFPLQAAIREDKPYNEVENGAKSTLTAIMGRMSAYSGKEVSWEQAMNSQLVLAPDQFTWDATPKILPGSDGNYPYAIPGKSIAL